MSDTDTERSTHHHRVVILRGSENYADWKLSVATSLTAKDLLEYITMDPPSKTASTAAERTQLKQAGQSFAIIVQSLSQVVQSSLSSQARSFTPPNPKLLWDELKSQYSVIVGARKAALLYDMWRTPVLEGEDPAPHMERIRATHSQLNGGGDQLSDQMLAFAMAMALPESFTTLKQSFWLHEPLKSASVAGAVQAEWSRRQTDKQTSNVLIAKQSSNKLKPRGHSNRNAPKDRSKWCDYHKQHGHNDSECFYQQKMKQSTNSNLVTPSANFASLTIVSGPSDEHTRTSPNIDDDFIPYSHP